MGEAQTHQALCEDLLMLSGRNVMEAIEVDAWIEH